MKKYLLYISLTVLLFGFNACDFLDETNPNVIKVEDFYESEQDLEDGLTAAYAAIRTAYNQLYYVTEMKSDNATTTNTGDAGGLYATFITHLVSSNNTIVTNIYNNFYYCIFRANTVLKYADKVNISDESQVRITAEAKFLRALAHFYLVRLWGPVTIGDHIFETTDDAKAAIRNSVDDVYEFIIEDLKEVVECTQLATFEGGGRMGHATRTAGAALLGKVYVTMAAMLNRPELYSDAVTCLQQACTLNAMYSLPTAYTGVFGLTNEGCTELIFQIMYNVSNSSTFAYDFQPYGQVGILTGGNIKGRGCNMGEQNLKNEFEEGDRRIAVCLTATADGSALYTKKYVDMTTSTGQCSNNWIEMRFADVFLLLAEAYEQLGDRNNAIKYLDLVRVRHSSLKDYEASLSDYPDYAVKYPTLRAAIFHERRIELCFENHRWFDLQRLYPNAKDLETYMRSIDISLKYTGFQAYEAFLPIPYDETIFNKKIYQNEGYK